MSNQANIRDIQILGDLKTAFGRFGEDVLRVLAVLEKQFEEIQGQLEQRQEHWQRQVEAAQEAVYEARRSLNECESQPEDEEGGSPDCSSEAEQVSDAERDLAGYEENLETVKQWRHRIEGQIADFQGDMHRLSNLASSRTSSVQAFLANKIEILDRYVGTGSSSGSSGYTTNGTPLFANKESSTPSQKNVTELPPELIAELNSDTLASSVHPEILDPRMGQNIPFPKGKIKFIRRADKRPRNTNLRSEFIDEWHERGYQTPEGGWSRYDIHHIHPVELGGTDDFWNLVPVERKRHQELFNKFWDDYGYWMEKLT